MAMCHQSRFVAKDYLNIADQKGTPTKAYMEARILNSRDEFRFGVYTGRDAEPHLGFDLSKTDVKGNGQIRSTELVEWIFPTGKWWPRSRRGKAYTEKLRTLAMENGNGGYEPANSDEPVNTGTFADRARTVASLVHDEEGTEMQPVTARNTTGRQGASASGSEQRYMMSGARRTNTVTFGDQDIS